MKGNIIKGKISSINNWLCSTFPWFPGARFTKNLTIKIIVSPYHKLLVICLKFITELKSLDIQKI